MSFLKHPLLAVVLLFVFQPSFGQQAVVHKCATDQMEQALRDAHPDWVVHIDQANAALDLHALEQKESASKQGTVYIIPVVFHVLHDFGPENITEEQIYTAMRVLNDDFRMRNLDIVDVIPEFQSITGDAEIEFRLARFDPSGDPTTGIEKIATPETFIGDDDSKLGPWPRDQYLNVWTADVVGVGNAAAYAYLPGSVDFAFSAPIDGILSNHEYIGNVGTGSIGGSSRTLTHEVGHFLNLSHPWGGNNDSGDPGNCAIDDGVSDTPNTLGASGCNLASVTCGSLDNIQNLMDYSSCERMLTQGQVARMRSALTSTIAERNELWQSGNLTATGVDQLWEANFITNDRVICAGDDVAFVDRTAYGQTSWDWDLTGGLPANSDQAEPVVTFNAPGLYNITLEASNGTASKTETKTDYILVTPHVGTHLPYSEGFEEDEVPNLEWFPVNFNEDNFRWERNTFVGATGTASMKMNNFSNTSETREIFNSTSFDFSPLTTISFSFKVAYAQRFVTSDDRLSLECSKDCGESWLQLWTVSGAGLASVPASNSAFNPTSPDHWTTFSANFMPPDYYVENLRFRFVLTNGGGNNLYLDDIEIEGDFDPVPVLEVPENNGPTQAENVLLNWKAVEGVTSYEYELDEDPTFTSPALQTGTKDYISVDPRNEDTEFQTAGLKRGQTYHWRVRANGPAGTSDWSEPWSFAVSADGVGIEDAVSEFLSVQVFPNPMTNKSVILVQLEQAQKVNIGVYDILGREVAKIADEYLSPGEHQFSLDKKTMSEGLYLVRVRSENSDSVIKLMVN